MVTRLILSDGKILYPNFLSGEEKSALRERMAREDLTMRCSCRDDVELCYGVSADNKIYPLHNGYEHAPWCSRRQTEERTSPFVYEEDGTSTVFLTFDPVVFTPARMDSSERIEDAGEDADETDDATVKLPENTGDAGRGKKEMLPRCNLWQMIATVNRDTYSERLMNGKNAVLSEDYFTTAVLARCRMVYPSGGKKSLRALSLKEDHVAFVYGKVAKCEDSAVFIHGREDKIYRRFVPDNVMDRALKTFEVAYGKTVGECVETEMPVYVSGFVYKKISRAGNIYTCFGRLCFFLTTRNGLFAGSMFEKDVLEKVFSYARSCGGTFLFPDSESAEHFGVLRISAQRKEGRIYLKRKAPAEYTGAALCLSDVPTDEELEKFVGDICF